MPEGSKNIRTRTDPPFEDIVGVILAGGRSTRYGRNKAFETLGGKSLIGRVVETMTSLFRETILMTNTPSEYEHLGLAMHQDLIKGLGPIGGIYTALKIIQKDAGFFVACDMPFLNRALISHMVSIMEDFDVIVPRMGWKIEALHALYRKRCVAQIEKNINDGIYQVIRVFEHVTVRYVEEEEIRQFDPQFQSFLNINRPQDLRRLENLCLSS